MKSPPKGKGKRSKQKSIDGTRIIPTYNLNDVPLTVKKQTRPSIRKEGPLIRPLRAVPKPEQPKPEKLKSNPKPIFNSWNPECVSIVGEVLDSYPEGAIVPKETIWEDVKKLVLEGGKFQTPKVGINDYRVQINWILSENYYRYRNITVTYTKDVS